jgi:hypothetical protein
MRWGFVPPLQGGGGLLRESNLVITHILGSLMSVLLFCNDSKPRRGEMFIVNPGPTYAPFVFQRGGGQPL